MEKRGIPSVVICTDEFLSLGKSIAEFLGMPTLKIVSIPHPLGGLEKEDVLKRAEVAHEEIAAALTAAKSAAKAR
ncbi:MAG: hypothetical protein HYX92_07600 [Chloroflexi bacterium]|nr:hypothetical protein [Chloroflexota bacterium]